MSVLGLSFSQHGKSPEGVCSVETLSPIIFLVFINSPGKCQAFVENKKSVCVCGGRAAEGLAKETYHALQKDWKKQCEDLLFTLRTIRRLRRRRLRKASTNTKPSHVNEMGYLW